MNMQWKYQPLGRNTSGAPSDWGAHYEIVGDDEFVGFCLTEEHARLFAAAPALLAALEFIVNDVPKPGENAELTAAGYNMACAAIALATAPPSAPVSAGTTTSG